MPPTLPYDRIEPALRLLGERASEQPRLEELARAAGMSPFHFQRIFREWVGISPKRFLQYITVEHARALLERSHTVLDAALEVGLSGPGRLHDHFVSLQATTPGEYKAAGAGVRVAYGWFPSPFGECLAAGTARGLCYLGFSTATGRGGAWEDLRARWPKADFRADPEAVRGWWATVFPDDGTRAGPAGRVPLHVRGTPFQVQVWEALLRVPEGAAVPYGALARAVGRPRAARAVGAAVGANPVSYLIPCHRVIRSMGLTGEYHWGATRKRAMLGWEAGRVAEGGRLKAECGARRAEGGRRKVESGRRKAEGGAC